MLKILRVTEEVNPVSRENYWNQTYKSIDIEKINHRLLSDKIDGYTEYTNVIKIYILNKDISKKKIVELACGTAPLGFYFRKKFKKNIICSDYSQIILDRLKKYDFEVQKSNISNLREFKENSLDYIFLGGGFYEDQNPLFLNKVFSSLNKKLKDRGRIYIFMNRYFSLINLKTYIQSLYFCKISPKSWKWMRKIFNKNEINYEVALYLYSTKFIIKNLLKHNLICKKVDYVGHALGLIELFEIVLSKNLLHKFRNSKLLIKIAKYLQRKKINLFSTRCVLTIEKIN